MTIWKEKTNKVIDKGFRSCRFVSTIVKHPVVTWNRFPIKNLPIDSLLTPNVESAYTTLLFRMA